MEGGQAAGIHSTQDQPTTGPTSTTSRDNPARPLKVDLYDVSPGSLESVAMIPEVSGGTKRERLVSARRGRRDVEGGHMCWCAVHPR